MTEMKYAIFDFKKIQMSGNEGMSIAGRNANVCVASCCPVTWPLVSTGGGKIRDKINRGLVEPIRQLRPV